MLMENPVEFLKHIEIFSLLAPGEIDSIGPLFRSRRVGAGEILFREGDEGSEMFIVRSGAVATSLNLPDGTERQIAMFREGNFFGEMSIFEKAARSATCTGAEDSTLICLHEDDFYRMIDEYPGVATKIMFRMLNITAQRLRDTGEFLSDMVHWGEAARRRAITDELTGAYNRRFLDEAMPGNLERARVAGNPLSIVMVDLDYFREINENYGHETGDRCIVEVVRVFNRVLRESDILARFGGDEFTILMPEVPSGAALEMAERAREQVAQLDFLRQFNGKVTGITLSMGVASYPEDGDEALALKQAADRALYRAKESGRNRAVCAGSFKEGAV
jgi:diguanylate cyclase (GGDEF)-like protein